MLRRRARPSVDGGGSRCLLTASLSRAQLAEVQSRLRGQSVATPPEGASAAKVQRMRLGAAAVARLEAAVHALGADAVHATAEVVLCGRAARRWHRAVGCKAKVLSQSAAECLTHATSYATGLLTAWRCLWQVCAAAGGQQARAFCDAALISH